MTSSRCRFTLTLLVLSIVAASTVAHAQTFSVLYNFGSKTGDPIQPSYSGIIAQGRDGNLYSTANGGTNGAGAVFKITPAGTLTVLYSFTGGADGNQPEAGLTLGADGNFYGTTVSGGASGNGTIFKVTPSGTLTPLYSFPGAPDGAQPKAPPIQGTDGNLYGTTEWGGTNTIGTVYKITLSGKLTTLYSFDNTHGDFPVAPLVQGTDGNFYGTASGGGTGPGVVYKITASGKLTVLYNFDGGHGTQPLSPLVQASDGNFYGTASSGGTKGGGVVFKLTPTGKLSVLHNMNPTTDGQNPIGGLVQATDGNFYGANVVGPGNGPGTFFRITPKGTLSVLHPFDTTTGSTPYVTPFQHTTGTVYGDTQLGGTGNVSPCSVGQCGVFYAWSAATLSPFASLLSTSGKVSKIIEILGQGFKGTTGVSFNGTAASYKIVSDTYLTATVPNGATTGSVTVKTPGGTLTSNKQFRVTPVILSFSPTSGPVGTPVVIMGNSLTQTTKVTFGGVKATSFTVNSDMQVTATVPTGAKTGKIAITTPGGTAVSKDIFTVTP